MAGDPSRAPAVALSGVYMAALDLDPGLHVYALLRTVDDQSVVDSCPKLSSCTSRRAI